MISIEVAGLPAAQGSKRHVGNGRLIEMSKAVGPWREAVRAEAQRAMSGCLPLEGPLAVWVTFWLPRPRSTPKRVLRPAKRPDVDKLARAVLDGLTAGGAWHDDGQVVKLVAVKRFAAGVDKPGCTIVVMEENSELPHAAGRAALRRGAHGGRLGRGIPVHPPPGPLRPAPGHVRPGRRQREHQQCWPAVPVGL